MNDVPWSAYDALTLESKLRVVEVCDRFEDAWREGGRRPRIEDYLGDRSAPEFRVLLRELLGLDLVYLRQQGEAPSREEYLALFPGHAGLIDIAFEELPRSPGETRQPLGAAGGPHAGATPLARFGRYRATQEWGRGAFGVVYKGYDEKLRRVVAIKVPRREAVASAGAVDAFLKEARILAELDHPGIVPVYDFGSTPDALYYVVSQFIEGGDLARRLKRGRLPPAEAAEIVSQVAEALHHAHERGLVHRDIKPANLLLKEDGRPVVADFGLALRVQNTGTGPNFAGTPAYMSLEQIDRRADQVDRRTDVYSLGVVFYELLTGQLPFRVLGRSLEELLVAIKTEEPSPPHQLDDAVDSTLSQLCMKCLAKLPADRYPTAQNLADALWRWLASDPSPAPPVPGPAANARPPVKVIPKGLRSYEAADADFFLELLPGPTDRDGLPQSIRFWKSPLEETRPDRAFRVGLLHGPSGCGKSSLVKAGLLPRLAGHVQPIYIEAVPGETEARLLRGLREGCPDLPKGPGLVETLVRLRFAKGLPVGKKKVLLVLDQFEQWLHAGWDGPGAELLRALRQCDGQHLQGLILVRDDFSTAAFRFMRDLGVRIDSNGNFAAVDLFDPGHALDVLEAFGRALGRLPGGPGALTPPHQRFLEQAVARLTRNGRVVPVHLALFVEMVKGKPWDTATLHEVGGTEAPVVWFLEEAFGTRTANPEHWAHALAAQAVLKALLPGPGTDIRGHRCSHQTLLEASGYADRPRDFDELLSVLDTQLRLLTPADVSGRADAPAEPAPVATGKRSYQLTHDFLVPGLRLWLSRKQRETRRGRAALLLTERAALWEARPEGRQLPSFLESMRIGLFTHHKDWTEPQSQMMGRATRRHFFRSLAAGILFGAVPAVAWYTVQRRSEEVARALVQRVLTAVPWPSPDLLLEVEPYRRWANPSLLETSQDSQAPLPQRLNAYLALKLEDRRPMDKEVVLHFVDRLLKADPEEFQVLRGALQGPDEAYRLPLVDRLQQELNHEAPRGGPPGAADRLLQRKAQAAVALLQLGSDAVWERLRHRADPSPQSAAIPLSPPVLSLPWRHGFNKPDLRLDPGMMAPGLDPDVRTCFLHQIGLLKVDAHAVFHRLKVEENVSARRALILALGEFAGEQTTALRASAMELLLKWYEEDSDPGVHSALDWLLRQVWGQGAVLSRLDQRLTKDKLQPVKGRLSGLGRRWYVTGGVDHTMARVYNSAPFRFGSPLSERGRNQANEATHARQMTRFFEIATKEVTVAQFRKFLQANPSLEKEFVQPGVALPAGAEEETPVAGVSWFMAVAYCNWLSRTNDFAKELCFEMKGPNRVLLHVDQKGFRLPTAAEWEFACRAGEVTSRCYGSSETLLDKYAWHRGNSGARARPVGQLKPNDLGLFDVHGNVREWCLSPTFDPLLDDAPVDGFLVMQGQSMVVRGGAFDLGPEEARAAFWSLEPVGNRNPNLGFRVARTIDPPRKP